MSTVITDVDELQAMMDDLTEDYVLGNNIDASATSGWNAGTGFLPIGFYGIPFSGTFDGQGYTISDLYIFRTGTDNIGLFGEVDGATIEDVTLADFTIRGDDKVGTLAGECDNSTVSDIIVTDCAITIEDDYGGGLIGDLDTCTVTRCSNSGTVSATGNLSSYTGGLFGTSYTSTINKCYSTATVTSEDDFVGGLIGLSYRNNIDDCYATGAVTGDRYVGGFIGYSYDSQETVDDCFSTGAVTGNSDVGGFMGYSTSTVTTCYWDTTTSGQASSAAGTGYATATLKLFATFYNAGWDVGQTNATRNNGYPYLGWETDDTGYAWYIYGEGTWATYGASFDFPDLLDEKGRPVKNANIDAYRVDTHSLVASKITDSNGTANFSELPVGIDTFFHATYGGVGTHEKEEWFFLRVNQIEDGGTGSGTTTGALDNLGVHGVAMLWELVLGD